MLINKIELSIRELAEFLYLFGNLSNELFRSITQEDGNRIHRYYQSKFKKEDIEVYLEYDFILDDINFFLRGRIDCIILDLIPTIIEIKSTKNNFIDFNFSNIKKEHLAQALFYGYIYALKNNLTSINIKIVYINVDDYNEYEFIKNYTFLELKDFFIESLNKYISHIKMIDKYQINKFNSLKSLKFPFENYRRGQREFMIQTYYSIKNNLCLHAIAPTGIGKTISSIFSSLKALSHYNEKIFYLTAKSSGKDIAINTIKLLKEQNIFLKAIIITKKEEMCALGLKKCDTENCIYAKKYYDKLNNLINEMFLNYSIYDKLTIKEFAIKNEICPFEFQLDLSYYADIIICDYNYVFDPLVHLIRYFENYTYKPIILIDEAHNLVKRSQDMYTKEISYNEILDLKKFLKGLKPYIKKDIELLINHMDDLLTIESNFIYKDDLSILLIEYLKNLKSKIEKILRKNNELNNKDEILDIYFKINDFLKISEYYDSNFKFVISKDNSDKKYLIKCLDASNIISSYAKHNIPIIFFSATMYPLFYYKKLLYNDSNSLIINSPFDYSNLKLIIKDIDTTYKNRYISLNDIIDLIKKTINIKIGNYIIFFPSYEYLNIFKENILKDEFFNDIYIYLQVQNQNLEDKNYILNEFKNIKDKSQLGLFVTGGSFSEGIDYIGDMLSGVYVITVCLPIINDMNNLLMEHYNLKYQNGFDYAYLYPGFNKVIQAVGRVIRSNTDYGFAILIDYRFKMPKYKNIFPKEWKNYKIINDNDKIKKELIEFFNKKRR